MYNLYLYTYECIKIIFVMFVLGLLIICFVDFDSISLFLFILKISILTTYHNVGTILGTMDLLVDKIIMKLLL